MVAQKAACHREPRTTTALSALAGLAYNDEAEKDEYEIESGRDFQNTEFLFYAVSFSGMMNCPFISSFSMSAE